MRRGAATTSRALEEQAKASEQVSRESQNLARQIAGVSKAMSEQSVAATQVAATTRSMSRQSDQVAKGAAEQARAARDMTTSIESISKDVGSITRSNRVHLDSSSKVLNAISEIRQVTTRNAASAKSLSGGASGLGDRAERLAELMNNMEAGNRSNGNPTGQRKQKKQGVSRECEFEFRRCIYNRQRSHRSGVGSGPRTTDAHQFRPGFWPFFDGRHSRSGNSRLDQALQTDTAGGRRHGSRSRVSPLLDRMPSANVFCALSGNAPARHDRPT